MSGAWDRVAMISGASRGIGAAIARRLIDDGWRVSLGLRKPEDAAWAGDHAHRFAYDAEAGGEDAWAAATLAAFGRIDAVVANAGVMIPGSVIDLDDADIDRMLAVNVKAPRRLVKAAWPALTDSGRGRVVIVASLSGKRVKGQGSGGYAMSKHAAVALAHGVRHAGWEAGVRATALCPGFVDTDMAREVVGEVDIEMTRPEEIARLCALALDLPNSASVAEICVNCADGDSY